MRVGLLLSAHSSIEDGITRLAIPYNSHRRSSRRKRNPSTATSDESLADLGLNAFLEYVGVALILTTEEYLRTVSPGLPLFIISDESKQVREKHIYTLAPSD